MMSTEWWNAAQAAEYLEVSEKTILRRARNLESRRQPMSGRRPERQWRAEDIRKLSEAERQPEVIQPEADARPPETDGPVWVHDGLAAPRAVSEGPERALALRAAPNGAGDVAGALAALLAPARPAPLALWLKLDEAAAYSGLSVACLRRLCQNGRLFSVRDRSVKISRASLDRYAEGGAGSGRDE